MRLALQNLCPPSRVVGQDLSALLRAETATHTLSDTGSTLSWGDSE